MKRTFPHARFGEVTIHTSQYANSGLAIQLTSMAEEGYEEPLAKLSVWVERSPQLPANCFFVKDWSENQMIVHEAARSGWFVRRPEFSPCACGWELAEVWELLEAKGDGFDLED